MKKLALSLLTTTAIATSSIAENIDIKQIEERLKFLEEQNQELIDEIADLKQQVAIPELVQQQFSGMGYAASKVYFSPKGLSIGGYGEITYQNWEKDKKTVSDVYRFIPYIGYKFTDKIILNSEIEFEHGDEVRLEFLYMDFLINDWINIRVGNFLIPVGIINLMHEPVFFNSVMRPEVETKIIPSTWYENGVMLFSNNEIFNYYLGVVNGFYYKNFTSSSWVRNGRQKGAKALTEDLAVLARVDYTGIEGLYVGASVYRGNSGQGDLDTNKNKIKGTVSFYETHLKYQIKNLEITGVYVKGELSDADIISTQIGETIGSDTYGYYLNVAYDIIPLITKSDKYSLPVFIRYEKYDTQDKAPAGFNKDKANEKTIWTVGFNFKPHPNVVLKADYQFRKNAKENEADVFEMGLGFIF